MILLKMHDQKISMDLCDEHQNLLLKDHPTERSVVPDCVHGLDFASVLIFSQKLILNNYDRERGTA